MQHPITKTPEHTTRQNDGKSRFQSWQFNGIAATNSIDLKYSAPVFRTTSLCRIRNRKSFQHSKSHLPTEVFVPNAGNRNSITLNNLDKKFCCVPMSGWKHEKNLWSVWFFECSSRLSVTLPISLDDLVFEEDQHPATPEEENIRSTE